MFKVNQRVYFLITSLSLLQCKPVRTWVFWLISQNEGLDVLFIDFLCMYMDDTYNNLRQHIFTCSRSTIETLEKVCSKSINTSERRQWRRSGAYIVKFEHISLLFLLLLQVTLNRYIFPGINYQILRQYVAATTFWVPKRLQKQSPKKLLSQLPDMSESFIEMPHDFNRKCNSNSSIYGTLLMRSLHTYTFCELLTFTPGKTNWFFIGMYINCRHVLCVKWLWKILVLNILEYFSLKSSILKTVIIWRSLIPTEECDFN